MAACIDRKTGKITLNIDKDDVERTQELVRQLLSAARVVEGGKRNVRSNQESHGGAHAAQGGNF